jgi:hypothetical protein
MRCTGRPSCRCHGQSKAESSEVERCSRQETTHARAGKHEARTSGYSAFQHRVQLPANDLALSQLLPLRAWPRLTLQAVRIAGPSFTIPVLGDTPRNRDTRYVLTGTRLRSTERRLFCAQLPAIHCGSRVLERSHDVPEALVRRRFDRSAISFCDIALSAIVGRSLQTVCSRKRKRSVKDRSERCEISGRVRACPLSAGSNVPIR